MQPKYVLAIVFPSLMIAGILALSKARSDKSFAGIQIQTSTPGYAASVEHLEEQTAANTQALKPTGTIATPQIDGLSIVEKHCTRCHTVYWLEEIEMTPAEWEASLRRMELNGALLSDAERSVLVEYYAAAEGLRDPN